MPCIFDIKPEDRHCRYCTDTICDERQPKPVETLTTNKLNSMTDKVQKIREEVEKLKSQLIRGACASQIAMETMCKEEAYNEVLAILDSLQEEPVSEKKCMYTKDDFTDEDRKVLCDGCEEDCEYAQREESVSEDTMTIRKDWFEHCKKSWYNEGYIDGKHNRDGQFGEPVSDECIYNRTLEERQRSCKFCSAACQVRIKEEPVSEDLEEEIGRYFKENGNKWAYIDVAHHFANWQKQQDQETIELAEDHAMLAGMEKMKEQMMAKAVDGDITFDYYGDGDKTYGCIAHNSFCLEDIGLKDRDKVKVIVIKED